MQYKNTLQDFKKWLLTDPVKRNYYNQRKNDDFYYAESKEGGSKIRKGHYLYNNDTESFEITYALSK